MQNGAGGFVKEAAVVVVNEGAHGGMIGAEKRLHVRYRLILGDAHYKALVHLPDIPMAGDGVLRRRDVVEGAVGKACCRYERVGNGVDVIAVVHIGEFDDFCDTVSAESIHDVAALVVRFAPDVVYETARVEQIVGAEALATDHVRPPRSGRS